MLWHGSSSTDGRLSADRATSTVWKYRLDVTSPVIYHPQLPFSVATPAKRASIHFI